MTKIEFTKMHALGNDFMIINTLKSPITFSPSEIRHWANRHKGVGFDQLLILEKSKDEQSDFFYRIFNADASEVGQCGNGARCIGAFIWKKKLTKKNPIILRTEEGSVSIYKTNVNEISVTLPPPIFTPAKIPFIVAEESLLYSLRLEKFEKRVVNACVLSLGNPHCVIEVPDVSKALVKEWGTYITKHEWFPLQTNVEFMQILSRTHIQLRVYERGVGETLACGSGACAAVIAGQILGKLEENVEVQLRGGRVNVKCHEGRSEVILTGGTEFIFEGVI